MLNVTGVSKSQDDVLRESVRTKDVKHCGFLLLRWFLSRENLQFIPVSEIALDLEKLMFMNPCIVM